MKQREKKLQDCKQRTEESKNLEKINKKERGMKKNKRNE
jgi:hypothetical protein